MREVRRPMRFSEIADAAAVVAVSVGLGARFGWWLAVTIGGFFVIISNWVRAR